ncbi:MAG: NUDIX hydrolase [Planctomycetota bacterium]
MERHDDVELLASRSVFQGRIFELVEESVRLPSGLRQDVVVVDHPGAVCVAPLLASGELLLVRQYRHAAGAWLTEIPAGRLEPDEPRQAAAERELEEETGHRATRWELLEDFYAAPGFCSERMTLFLASGLEEVPGGGLAADDDEELELVRARPSELLAGASCDAKTILAAAVLVARGLGR